MDTLAENWGTRRAALIFAGFFALLFLQLPLRGELPGNVDTLLAISLANLFLEKVRLIFSALPTLTALYPATDPLAYGENCYGLGLVFLFFKLLTSSDIWGYYLFLVTLFTLNSLSVFRLSLLFTHHRLASLLAGLAYSIAGFTLSNIDDPNVVFIFFPATSLFFFYKGLEERSPRLLRLSILFTGLQIWFGGYLFALQILLMALHFGMRISEVRSILRSRDWGYLSLAFFASAGPLLALYFYNHFFAGVISPYDSAHVVTSTSVGLRHFWNVLPRNLLYHDANNLYSAADDSAWASIRKNCFLGFLLPSLAVLGLARQWRARKELAATVFLFLVLAFGSNLPGYDALVSLPFLRYLRVPSRALVLTVLALSVFFGLGARELFERLNGPSPFPRVLLALALTAGIIVENAPFPLPGFEYASILKPPPAYAGFFSKFPTRQIVVDLPSTARWTAQEATGLRGRLEFYTREFFYMNWVGYHHQIILNGLNGYLPASRAKYDPFIRSLPDPASLSELRKLGVTHLVFHKGLILTPEEANLHALKSSNGLTLRHEDEELAIFELVH